MKILFKHGHVVDYKTHTDEVLDLLVENEKITKIGPNISDSVDQVIDCTGLFLLPGMIDMHCHLRQPGFEHKETIETGSKSAVKGGFTTICPMPNTKPVPDSSETLAWIQAEAKRVGLCHILPYASVTKGELGEELVDFAALKKAGAIAFSDDGRPVVSAKMMREAMIQADQQNTFVASHCEELSVAKGAIQTGPVAEKLGVEGVYPEAEEIMAAREIVLSETNHVRGHICHISTKTSVDMIRDAKKRGVPITCETCPHYFSFTVEEVLTSGANAKMNPPLREEKDRLAIIQGLQDGTIDTLITDHAPHAKEEKDKDLASAPNGIIGFETAFAAANTHLIQPGHLDFLNFVRLSSYTPSRLLHIDSERGSLEPGKLADIMIVDPTVSYVYTEDSIVSKSKNSPFIGKTLTGKVKYTICEGRIVYEDGKEI